MLPRLIAIAVLLVLNGFFVAAEFALVRSRRTRLESMARTGDWKARLALRAASNLARVYSASQLGVTLASLALGGSPHEFYLWRDPAQRSRVLAYVAMWGHQQTDLQVADLSDPAAPVCAQTSGALRTQAAAAMAIAEIFIFLN